jgi:hypothetical protein
MGGFAAFGGDVLKTGILVGSEENIRTGERGMRDLLESKVLQAFGHGPCGEFESGEGEGSALLEEVLQGIGLESFDGVEEVSIEFACFVNGKKRWVLRASLSTGICEKGTFKGAVS